MTTRDYIELIIAILGGVGLLAAGFGYAIGQFRKGQFDRRKDDISDKKSVLDLLQEQIDSLEELCAKQQTEIVELRTRSEEREKKAKEYIEIFQYRDPAMQTFMKYITDTANASNAYMKDTSLLFTQLKDVMNKIEHHLNNQH